MQFRNRLENQTLSKIENKSKTMNNVMNSEIIFSKVKSVIFDLQGTLIDHSTPPKINSDAIECLEKLKHLRLHLVSEGKKIDDLNSFLKNYHINHYFESILHAKKLGLTKIDGSAFRHILNQTDLLPENLVVIGDVPFSDICGANIVGIPNVRLKRGKFKSLRSINKETTPDYVVNNLIEFADLFNFF